MGSPPWMYGQCNGDGTRVSDRECFVERETWREMFPRILRPFERCTVVVFFFFFLSKFKIFNGNFSFSFKIIVRRLFPNFILFFGNFFLRRFVNKINLFQF